ncbi:MAG TPA: glycosyltransferase family 4 protein [Allosphingosinicella sp.]|jgi:glycosyltransferase involved in cell wall biosynthesis
MKILYVVQNFRQGWGGGPESVRLMANLLAPRGISADVFDLGRFRRNIETLELLPEPGRAAEPFPLDTAPDYDAILIVGPWQNAAQLGPLLKRRPDGQQMLYLPRGGLGRIEFSRLRDLKKIPYFHLIERRLLDRSGGIVFSSEVERDHSIAAARRRAPEWVIPDFFDSPDLTAPAAAQAAERAEGAGEGDRPLTLSFLAEISPRKGLLPLVEGFAAWAAARPSGSRPVRLVVGGAPRAGSERYLAAVHAVQRRHAGRADIEFVGPVAHGDRQRFYADTDVMVVSSLFESYGLTVLEALSAGCATLAAPDLGVLEYLPAYSRLTIARGAAAADFEAALGPAAASAEAGGREATRSYAAAAIAAINARALAAWTELLGGT